MEPVYLFDPWLVELNETDTTETIFKRYRALMKMQELHRKYGMKRVRFITISQLHEFYANNTKSQRSDIREIAQIINSVLITPVCQALPAEIVDRPCPALSEQWSGALGGSSSDWRRPIIVLPEARTANWPNHTLKERELKYRIDGSAEPITRNLVCIESYDNHTYFEPDLDPWRIGAVGSPAKTVSGRIGGSQESIIRVLPRPLHRLPLSLTFTKMVEELRKHIDCSCGQENKTYYIPRRDWDPRTICREDWRNGNIFQTDSVQGGRSGPVDQDGFIWLWDQFHKNHWDVQLPDGSKHRNVSHDGKIL